MSYRKKVTDNRYMIGTGGVRDHYKCDGTHIKTLYCSEVEAGDYEVITYESSGKRDSGSRHKNCRHIHDTKVYLPLNVSVLNQDVPLGEDLVYQSWATGTIWNSAGHDALSVEPTSSTLQNYSALAFDAMKPSLEGDLQLTNFLLELVDVKHILSLFTKWEGFVKKIAAGHLSYAFGVKPFLQDVKELYDNLTNFEGYITQFLSRRNTVQRRHYRLKFIEDDGTYEGVAGGFGLVEGTYKVKGVYHATMDYTYSCPNLDNLQGQIRALRDLLGLRFGLSQLWEAIPFSFVVDWFIRVGDWLKQYEQPLVPVNLTVVDYCESYKIESSIEWEYYGVSPCGPQVGATTQYMGNRNTKVYVRRRSLPNSGSFFINPGQFGGNQLALSASLLTTMAGSKRR